VRRANGFFTWVVGKTRLSLSKLEEKELATLRFNSFQSHKKRNKKFTAAFVAAVVFLTSGALVYVPSLLSPVFSDETLKTPSQKGSGEVLTEQIVSTSALKANEIAILNVTLPKSGTNPDSEMLFKHQLLVRVDTVNARVAGELNISTMNDWNVATRDTQSAAYKYPVGNASFTTLVTVSNDYHLTALATTDVEVKLTALAAFSDAADAEEPITFESLDKNSSKNYATDDESSVSVNADVISDALDENSNGDYKTSKGELAPGGTKAITPIVLVDNKDEIGDTVQNENRVSVLGKSRIPHRQQNDPYPVRGVYLSVQTGNTEVVLDGNTVAKNSNELVLATVDEKGGVEFSVTNTNADIKITAVGYVGASFYNESQTVIEGGMVILGANTDSVTANSDESLVQIDGLKGAAMFLSANFASPDEESSANLNESDITIDEIGNVDLSANLMIRVSGTIHATPELKSIAIYADSQFITTANIDQSKTPARWFAYMTPGIGKADITAVARTYQNTEYTATTQANGTNSPSPDTPIITHDANALETDALSRITKFYANSITFSGNQDILVPECDSTGTPIIDPNTGQVAMHIIDAGDIIVAKNDDASIAPSFSRRVVAVDKFPSKIVFTTVNAALDEMYAQVNVQQEVNATATDYIKAHPDMQMNEEAGVIEGTLSQEVTEEEFAAMQDLEDANVTKDELTDEQSKILTNALLGEENAQNNELQDRIENAPNEPYTDEERALEESLLLQAKLIQDNTDENGKIINPSKVKDDLEEAQANDISLSFCLNPTIKFILKGNQNHASATLDAGFSLCVNVAVILEFGVGLTLKYGFIPELAYFHFRVGGSFTASFTLKGEVTGLIIFEGPSVTLFELMLDLVIIAILPLDITVETNFPFKPYVGAEGKVTFQYQWSYTTSSIYTYDWNKGGSAPKDNGTKNTSKSSNHTPILSASLEIIIGLKASVAISVGLFGLQITQLTIDPKVQLGIMVKTSTTPTPDASCTTAPAPCDQLTLNLGLQFEFEVGINFDVGLRPIGTNINLGINVPLTKLGPFTINIPILTVTYQVNLFSSPGTSDNPISPPTDDPTPVPTPAPPVPPRPAYSGPGSIYGYGDNSLGQLGNGDTKSETYSNLEPALGLSQTSKIVSSPSTDATYAIDASGALYAWGDNSQGQLGRGFTGDTIPDGELRINQKPANTPDRVVDSGGNPILEVIDVAAFDGGGYALSQDGTVWAWGNNAYGQLGDGTAVSTNFAQKIPILNSVNTIKAGADTGYAVRDDGTIWMFGRDITKASGNQTVPIRVTLVSNANSNEITELAANKNNLYFIIGNTIYGIGKNDGVTFGAGKASYITAYTPIIGQPDEITTGGFQQLAANNETAYALGNDSRVYAWGKNDKGQFGNSTLPQDQTYRQMTSWSVDTVQGTPATEAVYIAAGNGFAAAVMDDGSVMGWGDNSYAQLGSVASQTPQSAPKVTSASHISKIAAGNKNLFVVKAIAAPIQNNGTLNSITYDSSGKTSIDALQAVGVNNAKKAVSNAMGEFVLQKDGTVLKLSNVEGQSTKVDNAAREINKIVDIAASDDAIFALTESGFIYSWADNISSTSLGRIATTTDDANTPTEINIVSETGIDRCGAKNEAGVDKISAFGRKVFAICQEPAGYAGNAKVIAWGDNTNLGLGIGANGTQIEPVLVTQLSTTDSLIDIQAGTHSTVVLTGTNTLHAFGETGTDAFNAAIETFSASQQTVAMTASYGGFYFVSTLGEVYTIGTSVNTGNQCAISITNVTKVSGLQDSFITNLAAHKTSNTNTPDVIFAQTDDSEIIAFGTNFASQSTCINQPYNFMQTVNTVNVFARNGKAYILTADYNQPAGLPSSGNLYTAGNNDDGQLAIGTHTSQGVLETASSFEGKSISLATGNDAAGYAVLGDGTVLSFGDNSVGQRGIGDTSQNHDVTSQVIGLKNVVSLVANKNAAFALDNLGNVYAWGEMFNGDSYLVPQKLQTVTNIMQIAANNQYLYMVRSNGSLIRWSTDFNDDIEVLQSVRHVLQLQVTSSSLLILKSPSIADATHSDSGQSDPPNIVQTASLDGTNIQTVTFPVSSGQKPPQISSIAASIDARSAETEPVGDDDPTYYALVAGSQVYSWGSNSMGQANPLSDLDVILTPELISSNITNSNITKVVAGKGVAYLLGRDGTLTAFGTNFYGELAHGNQDVTREAVKITGYGISSVGVGAGSLFAVGQVDPTILASGRVYAMGDNVNDTLGVDSEMDSITQFTSLKCSTNDQTADCALPGITKVVTNGTTSLALDESKNVWQWGKAFDSDLILTEPTLVSAVKNVTDIAIGDANAYILKTDTTVWSWGANDKGQLGNNKADITMLPNTSPQIVWGLYNVTKIGAGADAAFAKKTDGSTYSWGANDKHQLGLGEYMLEDFYVKPQLMTALTGISIKEFAAGDETGYALTNFGEVYSWGEGSLGERGDGDISDDIQYTSVPHKISLKIGDQQDDPTVFALHISAGGHTAYITGNDGFIYAWGQNDKGQLGTTDGETPLPNACMTSPYNTFIQGGVDAVVSNRPGSSKVVAGNKGAFVINDDNQTIGGWGDNSSGQLSILKNNTSYTTKQDLIKSYQAYPLNLAAGGNQVYIIVPIDPEAGTDTNIWAVGNNDKYQLGQGNASSASSSKLLPVKAATDAEGVIAKTVAAVGSTGAAALQDGRVVTWGENANGLLGRLSTGNSNLAEFVSAPVGGQQFLIAPASVSCDAWLCEVKTIVQTTSAFYALTQGGAIYAWGDYQGSVKNFPTLVQNGATGTTSIVDIITRIDADGDRLIAWHEPEDADGELNPQSVYAWTNQTEPQSFQIVSGVSDAIINAFVSASAYYVTATTENGKKLYAWGSNDNCALADTTSCTLASPHEAETPFIPTMLTASGLDMMDITVINNVNYAVDNKNKVWSWSGATGKFEPLINQTQNLGPTGFAGNSASIFLYTTCDPNAADCSPGQVYAMGTNTYGQLGTGDVNDAPDWVIASEYGTQLAVTDITAGSSGFSIGVGVTPMPPVIGNRIMNYEQMAGDDFTLDLAISAAPFPSSDQITITYGDGFSSLSDIGLELNCEDNKCKVLGTLQGEPGLYAFIVTVTTLLGTVQQQYQIILDGEEPQFTSGANNACTIFASTNTYPTTFNIGDDIDIPICTTGTPSPDVTALSLPPGIRINASNVKEDLDRGITHRIQGTISATAATSYTSILTAKNAVIPDGVSISIAFSVMQDLALNVPCINIMEAGEQRCVIQQSTEDAIDIDLGIFANPMPDITNVSVTPQDALDALGITLMAKPVAVEGSADALNRFILTSNGATSIRAGKYQLTLAVATNGEPVTKVFWFYIANEVPSISGDISCDAVVGSQIHFPVNITGLPFPNITPYGYIKLADGVQSFGEGLPEFLHLDITGDGQIGSQTLDTLNSAVLTSRALTADDIGMYTIGLQAENIAHTSVFYITINITGTPPQIDIEDQTYFYDFSVSSKPEIDFTVTGNPSPTVEITSETFTALDPNQNMTNVPTSLFTLDDGATGYGPFSLFAIRNFKKTDVGEYKITLKAYNAMDPTNGVEKTVSIFIAEKAEFNITGRTEYAVGEAANFNLGVTGTPCPDATDIVYSALDNAINMDVTPNINGEITGDCQAGIYFESGALTTSGSYQFTFTMTQEISGHPNQTVTSVYSATVHGIEPTIKLPPTLPVIEGTTFDETVQITGNPCPSDVTFSVTGAPEWITLTKDGASWCTGAKLHINAPVSSRGQAYTVIISATSAGETVTASTVIEIVGVTPEFHTSQSTNGTVGKYFSLDLGITGDPFPTVAAQPVLLGAATLPAGLSLYNDANSNKWFIRGVPAKEQSVAFILTATNSAEYAITGKNSTAYQAMQISITGKSPTFNPIGTMSLLIGSSVNIPLGVTGVPCPQVAIDSASDQVDGLQIYGNCNDGWYLRGIVANSLQNVHNQEYDTKITASNSAGTASTILPLKLFSNDSPPIITVNSSFTLTRTRFASISLNVQGSPCPSVAIDDVSKLPPGMYLMPNSTCSNPYGARIVGIPTLVGDYTFTVSASNEKGTVSQAISVHVNQYTEEPKFYSATSAIGAEGDYFNMNLEISANPQAIVILNSLSDRLPSGIDIVQTADGSTYLQGIPDAGTAGTYDLILVANNGVGKMATHTIQLIIAVDSITPAFHMQSVTFSEAVGTHFDIPLLVSGTPCPLVTSEISAPTNSISADDLSVVGTCDGAGFTLSGQTTALGNTTILLTATNPSDITRTATEYITISAVPDAPNLVVQTDNYAAAGSAISIPIHLIGTPIPSLTAQNLPDGLTLLGGERDYRLQGEIDTLADYEFDLTAEGENKSATKHVAIHVTAGDLAFHIPSADIATLGTYYYLPLNIIGTPCPSQVSLADGSDALVDGLQITGGCQETPYALSGVISSNVDLGAYSFTFSMNNGKDALAHLTLTVTGNAPMFYGSDTATFTIGEFKTFDLDVAGNPNPNVQITNGTLPAGLSLEIIDAVNGDVAILGTPLKNTPSETKITVRAENPLDLSVFAEKVITIHVTGNAPAYTINPNISVLINEQFDYAFGLTGDPCPSLQVTSGALPPGSSIKGTNCTTDPYRIAGQIPVVGTFEAEITAHNGVNGTDSDAIIHFTFVSVADKPTINTNDSLLTTEGQFFAQDLGIAGTPCPLVTLTSNVTAGDEVSILQAADLSCNFKLIGHIINQGTYQATVTAQNAGGTLTKVIAIHAGGITPEFHTSAVVNVTEESFVKVPLNVTGDPFPAVSVKDSSAPDDLNVQLINNAWYLVGTLADDVQPDDYQIILVAKNVDAVGDEHVTEFTLNLTVENEKPVFNLPSDIHIALNSYYELSFGLNKMDVRIKDETNLPNNMFLTLQTASHKGWTIYGTPDVASDAPIVTTFELLENGIVKDTASINFYVTYSGTPEFHPTGKISYLNDEFINISLGVTGYPAPVVREVNPLPAGLSLTGNAATGYQLQGQITEIGAYSVMLEACSSGELDTICVTQKINIIITDATPVFNVDSNILLTAGVEKIINLNVTGAPKLGVKLSSGTLPKGLSYNENDFTISGTPVEVSESQVTFTATSTPESPGTPVSVTKTITFTVTSSIPQFMMPAQEIVTLDNYAYIPVSVTGDPCPKVTLQEGDLPDGLSFRGACDATGAATYHISGSIAAHDDITDEDLLGEYPITLAASNSYQTNEVSIVIKVVSRTPAFNSPDVASFVRGRFSAFDLGVTGDPYPSVNLLDDLPDGLKLVSYPHDKKTYIEGTPAKSADCDSPLFCTVTLTAINSSNETATKTLTIRINGNAPEISLSSADATSIVTAGFAEQTTIHLNVTGNPMPAVQIPDNQMPIGFKVAGARTNTPAITGKSTHAGTYPIEITATNMYGAQTLTLTLVILGADPKFGADSQVFLTLDSFADIDLGVTGGDLSQTPPAYPTVSVADATPLPDGLTLNELTDGNKSRWVVSGIPTVLGTHEVEFIATLDSGLLANSPVSFFMEINVSPSDPRFNTNGMVSDLLSKKILNTSATVDAKFSLDLAVTGNPKPKVTLESGALPPGLSITDDNKIVGIATGEIKEYKAVLVANNGQTPKEGSLLEHGDTLALTIETVGQKPQFNTLTNTLSGTLGQVLNIDLGITGYPFPIVTLIKGKLPDGISLVCKDARCYLQGQLTGTPNDVSFDLMARSPVLTSTNSTASAVRNSEVDASPITPYSLLITNSLPDTGYSISTFTFATSALAPSFLGTQKKVAAKDHEYISIPLHYSANPCTQVKATKLPKGLKINGTCSDGFQIQGIIDASPNTYGITVTGENAAGSAKSDIQLIVGKPNAPKDTPTHKPTPTPSSGGDNNGGNWYYYGGGTPTPTPTSTTSPTPTPTISPAPDDNASGGMIFGLTPFQFALIAIPIFLLLIALALFLFYIMSNRRYNKTEVRVRRHS
jgi:alpha-tubulin suppressor-like RCC1 family protein